MAWNNDTAKEPAKTMADTQKNTRRDAALRVFFCKNSLSGACPSRTCKIPYGYDTVEWSPSSSKTALSTDFHTLTPNNENPRKPLISRAPGFFTSTGQAYLL